MMKAELQKKINELIEECPNDWKKKAAKKLGKSREAVRLISMGMIGKTSNEPQLLLIDALKEVRDEENEKIKQRIA